MRPWTPGRERIYSGTDVFPWVVDLSKEVHIYMHFWAYELTKVDSVNGLGLGVKFDSKLAFSYHMNDKFNKAYRILGVIKRNFIYLDKDSFVLLYKAMIGPHVEYANSVCQSVVTI